jgi:hypothetical protein
MPLILDNPEVITVGSVRINSFSVRLLPTIAIDIQYCRIADDGSSADYKVASFGPDDVAKVDPSGATYDAMKLAMYALLETIVGPGTVQ